MSVAPLDRPEPDWFTNRRRRSSLLVAWWVPTVMVGLPILVIVCIVIYPTVWMIYHAFHDTSMMSLFNGNWQPVGWENFATVLGSSNKASGFLPPGC